jgi:hypothetical protein
MDFHEMRRRRCRQPAAGTADPSCGADIQATYSDRPPYLLPQADGSPAGLTGAPAAAFKASGIPVRWRGCRPTANWRWSRSTQPELRHRLVCHAGAHGIRQIHQGHLPRQGWMLLLANADFAARGITSISELRKPSRYPRAGQGQLFLWRHRQVHPEMESGGGCLHRLHREDGAIGGKGAVDLMFVSEDEGNYLLKQQPAMPPTCACCR